MHILTTVTLKKIEFSSGFLELGVYFKENPTYIDVALASDCFYYFLQEPLEKLGTSPTCYQNEKLLRVTLGSWYTLRKGDSQSILAPYKKEHKPGDPVRVFPFLLRPESPATTT